ncbi:MBL fold metallo-hydrolase [Natrarchaeobius sp. A-rgal3]|uniref:MBL fold metallo-hydrolase n=1 Tax=Natrarchaeobius versutus TaxID=1679078 RepID=UPI00350F61D6
MNATTDWYETERIAPGSYRITEGIGYLPINTYLLGDDDEWLLIDAGLGIGDLRAHAEAMAGTSPRVFLTHSHWDHVGSAHQFDDVVIHASEQRDGVVPVDTTTRGGVDLADTFVESWLETGSEFPDGFDPDGYDVPSVSGVETVEAGDVLEIGSTRLELLPIPGHSPGQLAALDRDAEICYAADVLSPDGSVFAQFDDSDLEAYADAVDRLLTLREDGAFDVLATGHGEPIRGDDLSVLDRVKTALESVLAGDASPRAEDDLWGPIHRYSVGDVDVVAQRS